MRRAAPVVGVGLELNVDPPVLPSTSRKGPEPTSSGWPSGSGWKVFTAFASMSFQMCSGTIGIGSSGSTALGFDSVSTTVVSSGAVTLVTLVR